MKFGFACLTVTIRCYSFAYKNYNKVCYVSQLRFYFLEIIFIFFLDFWIQPYWKYDANSM